MLWEWTNPDADVLVGQRLIPGGTPEVTSGRPVIVKVRDSGFPTGRWVDIVTAGYNNKSGIGKVYFLDVADGSTLATVTTPVGSGAESESGLAQIHAFVKNETNQIAEQIYGGDLFGKCVADRRVGGRTRTRRGARRAVREARRSFGSRSAGDGRRRRSRSTSATASTASIHRDRPPARTRTTCSIRSGAAADHVRHPRRHADRHPSNAALPIIRGRRWRDHGPDRSRRQNAIVGGAPNGWYHDLPNTAVDSERVVVDFRST